MIRKLLLTTAAATLAVSSVAAQAAAPQRSAAPIAAEDEQLTGSGILLPILIAIALAVGIWLIVDSDDEPTSP